MENIELIRPDWRVSDRVKACVTTRISGYSQAPYDSLNVGDHVGDDPKSVQRNRERLSLMLGLPSEPKWLNQVHGKTVLNAAQIQPGDQADASFSREPGVVCVVMTADCLPVFFSDAKGREVAVAHAGWRGLCDGVLEATIDAMQTPPSRIITWLGPAIGPEYFEVGDDVQSAFQQADSATTQAFRPLSNGKWLADMYMLARLRLERAGVKEVFGGGLCTFQGEKRFYSYRRDGAQSGRMASLIWME
jgi:YfiH family protein